KSLKGKPVPLILPSFQPLPFQSLFAIFIPSVFEVVQVGQVVHAELARVSASHITEFGLKKVVQGGTAVAESVPLFRLA
ncbi:hypothetical protein, partial [Klebsiella pneumoniae]|uniref:hypothetical protein n=1 Tax=Klebsiella pneumoniae TaxID=573 RepID=UPI001C12C061